MSIFMSIFIIIFILVVGLFIIYNIDDIMTFCIVIILFPLFYKPPDIVERKQSIRNINKQLVSYLRDYNPLHAYYDSLFLTTADVQFINKIIFNYPTKIIIDELSGIMILKIYFKRESLKDILSQDEYKELMCYAKNIYNMYENFINKNPGILFIPDMVGIEITCKQYRLHIDPGIVLFNETFYFNRYY